MEVTSRNRYGNVTMQYAKGAVMDPIIDEEGTEIDDGYSN